MVPAVETLPLYGMVWPSLISASVTPGPYFFSASAAADAISRQAPKTIGQRRLASITSSSKA